MTKILMYGCGGHMGHVICDLIKDMDNVEVAAGVDVQAGEQREFPVFASLDEVNVEVDAIIDFSAAPAVDAVLAYAADRQIPLVECTTGLSEEQLAYLEECSKKTAILRSANMSLGINTLLKMVKTAAKVLGEAGFDIDIVEKHHRRKLDAPSGTALALADSINEASDGKYQYVFDRSGRRMQQMRSVSPRYVEEPSSESMRLFLPEPTRLSSLNTPLTPEQYLARERSRLPSTWQVSRQGFTI